jgi:hypothetical protein
LWVFMKRTKRVVCFRQRVISANNIVGFDEQEKKNLKGGLRR